MRRTPYAPSAQEEMLDFWRSMIFPIVWQFVMPSEERRRVTYLDGKHGKPASSKKNLYA